MSLQKSVKTITLLSSAVAGIIGSGWLLSPLVCVKIAGPATIIAWIIGGLLMMIVASTFVILTRSFPITGGTVRFFQLHFKRGSWVIFYLIGIMLISYFGSFGGTKQILFGVDFGVIGVFSMVIYVFAYLLTSKNKQGDALIL